MVGDREAREIQGRNGIEAGGVLIKKEGVFERKKNVAKNASRTETGL